MSTGGIREVVKLTAPSFVRYIQAHVAIDESGVGLVDCRLDLRLNLRYATGCCACLGSVNRHQNDLHRAVRSGRVGRARRVLLRHIAAGRRRDLFMTMSRGVMSPLRRETVGIEFFNQRPTVRSRSDGKHVATALNATVEETFVQRQRNVAAIQLTAAAPNHTFRSAPLVTCAIESEIGLSGHDNGQAGGPCCQRRFVDIADFSRHAMATGRSRYGELAKQIRMRLRLGDGAERNEDRGAQQH